MRFTLYVMASTFGAFCAWDLPLLNFFGIVIVIAVVYEIGNFK